MNVEQKLIIKDLLLKKRAQIINSIYAKNSSEEISVGRDEGDLAQEALISSTISSLFDREKTQMKKIDLALRKIDLNSFGICEECEEEISEKRLMSMPHVQLCISCQEISEKEAKQFAR